MKLFLLFLLSTFSTHLSFALTSVKEHKIILPSEDHALPMSILAYVQYDPSEGQKLLGNSDLLLRVDLSTKPSGGLFYQIDTDWSASRGTKEDIDYSLLSPASYETDFEAYFLDLSLDFSSDPIQFRLCLSFESISGSETFEHVMLQLVEGEHDTSFDRSPLLIKFIMNSEFRDDSLLELGSPYSKVIETNLYSDEIKTIYVKSGTEEGKTLLIYTEPADGWFVSLSGIYDMRLNPIRYKEQSVLSNPKIYRIGSKLSAEQIEIEFELFAYSNADSLVFHFYLLPWNSYEILAYKSVEVASLKASSQESAPDSLEYSVYFTSVRVKGNLNSDEYLPFFGLFSYDGFHLTFNRIEWKILMDGVLSDGSADYTLSIKLGSKDVIVPIGYSYTNLPFANEFSQNNIQVVDDTVLITGFIPTQTFDAEVSFWVAYKTPGALSDNFGEVSLTADGVTTYADVSASGSTSGTIDGVAIGPFWRTVYQNHSPYVPMQKERSSMTCRWNPFLLLVDLDDDNEFRSDFNHGCGYDSVFADQEIYFFLQHNLGPNARHFSSSSILTTDPEPSHTAIYTCLQPIDFTEKAEGLQMKKIIQTTSDGENKSIEIAAGGLVGYPFYYSDTMNCFIFQDKDTLPTAPIENTFPNSDDPNLTSYIGFEGSINAIRAVKTDEFLFDYFWGYGNSMSSFESLYDTDPQKSTVKDKFIEDWNDGLIEIRGLHQFFVTDYGDSTTYLQDYINYDDSFLLSYDVFFDSTVGYPQTGRLSKTPNVMHLKFDNSRSSSTSYLQMFFNLFDPLPLSDSTNLVDCGFNFNTETEHTVYCVREEGVLFHYKTENMMDDKYNYYMNPFLLPKLRIELDSFGDEGIVSFPFKIDFAESNLEEFFADDSLFGSSVVSVNFDFKSEKNFPLNTLLLSVETDSDKKTFSEFNLKVFPASGEFSTKNDYGRSTNYHLDLAQTTISSTGSSSSFTSGEDVGITPLYSTIKSGEKTMAYFHKGRTESSFSDGDFDFTSSDSFLVDRHQAGLFVFCTDYDFRASTFSPSIYRSDAFFLSSSFRYLNEDTGTTSTCVEFPESVFTTTDSKITLDGFIFPKTNQFSSNSWASWADLNGQIVQNVKQKGQDWESNIISPFTHPQVKTWLVIQDLDFILETETTIPTGGVLIISSETASSPFLSITETYCVIEHNGEDGESLEISGDILSMSKIEIKIQFNQEVPAGELSFSLKMIRSTAKSSSGGLQYSLVVYLSSSIDSDEIIMESEDDVFMELDVQTKQIYTSLDLEKVSFTGDFIANYVSSGLFHIYQTFDSFRIAHELVLWFDVELISIDAAFSLEDETGKPLIVLEGFELQDASLSSGKGTRVVLSFEEDNLSLPNDLFLRFEGLIFPEMETNAWLTLEVAESLVELEGTKNLTISTEETFSYSTDKTGSILSYDYRYLFVPFELSIDITFDQDFSMSSYIHLVFPESFIIGLTSSDPECQEVQQNGEESLISCFVESDGTNFPYKRALTISDFSRNYSTSETIHLTIDTLERTTNLDEDLLFVIIPDHSTTKSVGVKTQSVIGDGIYLEKVLKSELASKEVGKITNLEIVTTFRGPFSQNSVVRVNLLFHDQKEVAIQKWLEENNQTLSCSVKVRQIYNDIPLEEFVEYIQVADSCNRTGTSVFLFNSSWELSDQSSISGYELLIQISGVYTSATVKHVDRTFGMQIYDENSKLYVIAESGLLELQSRSLAFVSGTSKQIKIHNKDSDGDIASLMSGFCEELAVELSSGIASESVQLEVSPEFSTVFFYNASIDQGKSSGTVKGCANFPFFKKGVGLVHDSVSEVGVSAFDYQIHSAKQQFTTVHDVFTIYKNDFEYTFTFCFEYEPFIKLVFSFDVSEEIQQYFKDEKELVFEKGQKCSSLFYLRDSGVPEPPEGIYSLKFHTNDTAVSSEDDYEIIILPLLKELVFSGSSSVNRIEAYSVEIALSFSLSCDVRVVILPKTIRIPDEVPWEMLGVLVSEEVLSEFTDEIQYSSSVEIHSFSGLTSGINYRILIGAYVNITGSYIYNELLFTTDTEVDENGDIPSVYQQTFEFDEDLSTEEITNLTCILENLAELAIGTVWTFSGYSCDIFDLSGYLQYNIFDPRSFSDSSSSSSSDSSTTNSDTSDFSDSGSFSDSSSSSDSSALRLLENEANNQVNLIYIPLGTEDISPSAIKDAVSSFFSNKITVRYLLNQAYSDYNETLNVVDVSSVEEFSFDSIQFNNDPVIEIESSNKLVISSISINGSGYFHACLWEVFSDTESQFYEPIYDEVKFGEILRKKNVKSKAISLTSQDFDASVSIEDLEEGHAYRLAYYAANLDPRPEGQKTEIVTQTFGTPKDKEYWSELSDGGEAEEFGRVLSVSSGLAMTLLSLGLIWMVS